MIHKPFFSIVIPTYNRADLLRTAIAIILQQTYKDFELIISNNCSTDNTSEVVKSFKDKRIRYFENEKNIRAEPNMKKAVSYAQGKYIFTQGDDDFILFEDTLEKIKKILDEKEYGFIRLNLIERKFIGEGIRKSIIKVNKDISLKKNAESREIMDFFMKVAASHWAGLILRNQPNLADKMIDSEVTAWIKILFDNTKRHGAHFLGNYYMVITWSQGGILDHYKLRKNKIMAEDYLETVLSYLPKEEREQYKLQYYKNFIILQPVIKLYGGMKQLILFDKRLLSIEKKLRYNLFFWIFFCVALIMPRTVWKLVRVIQHSTNDSIRELSDFRKVQKRYAYFHKRYKL